MVATSAAEVMDEQVVPANYKRVKLNMPSETWETAVPLAEHKHEMFFSCMAKKPIRLAF